MDLIREIHSYLSDDIQSMNKIIVESLSADEELIGIISSHLSSGGGKRIRPVLTILSAKMFGYNGENSIKLAAAVEFIHMATLLHDDVIDGSKMRRFLPTANVLWGNKASILVGDFLFSQSFKLIVSIRSFSALETLSRASAIIAEGEVSQLSQLENKELISEQDYIKIINAKTAELFGASCSVGAIIADRELDLEYIREFGLKLGNIFQISDDALDYFSETEKVGKNIGDDFYEGKVTLPLIFLFNKLGKKQKDTLNEIFFAEKRSKADFLYVRNLMFEHDIRSDIDDYLAKLGEKTKSALSSVKIDNDNQSKKYLQKLVDFAINRSY